MPELPDVEAFKRVLAKNALDKTIKTVAVSDRRILGELAAAAFVNRLQGAKLVAARRHGKHLLASIDRGGWPLLFTPKRGSSYANLNERQSNRIDLSQGTTDKKRAPVAAAQGCTS